MIARCVLLAIILLPFSSYPSIMNLERTNIIANGDSTFYKVRDGLKLFVYSYRPIENYHATLFIISGITGINHNSERDIIELLSNNKNRVVVIHPRGTGYSDGKRGDIEDFDDFINDYVELISNDEDYKSRHHKIFLYGHSMSTAVLLSVAGHLKNIDGAILVNPPYKQKQAKGMSPSIGQYFKYAWYFLFARHKPIVNMAGDPSKIESEEDRIDSEKNGRDTLLVKYFSMYYMTNVRKLLSSMPDFCKKANYPLLLIYGMKDSLVDKEGCDLIYQTWKHTKKKFILIENGSHGKSTVRLAAEEISTWINDK
jgi:alpha-beta hydrolase superfamily lysophospholipase